MEFKAVRTIENYGKIELPQSLRRQLNWRVDDVVEFYVHNGEIIIRLSKDSLGLKHSDCYARKLKKDIKGCNICGKCSARWLPEGSALKGIAPIPD